MIFIHKHGHRIIESELTIIVGKLIYIISLNVNTPTLIKTEPGFGLKCICLKSLKSHSYLKLG